MARVRCAVRSSGSSKILWPKRFSKAACMKANRCKSLWLTTNWCSAKAPRPPAPELSRAELLKYSLLQAACHSASGFFFSCQFFPDLCLDLCAALINVVMDVKETFGKEGVH